jgi:hypothetical protein
MLDNIGTPILSSVEEIGGYVTGGIEFGDSYIDENGNTIPVYQILQSVELFTYEIDPNIPFQFTRNQTTRGAESRTVRCLLPNGDFEYHQDVIYWNLINNVQVYESQFPTITCSSGLQTLPGFSPQSNFPINTTAYGYRLNQLAVKGINHPTYIDLLTGYSLDDRTIPDNPTIIPLSTQTISIGYYSENTLEPIPDLRSIYWKQVNINLTRNIPITLPIQKCVLGTLSISSPDVISQVKNLPTVAGNYNWIYLFVDSLPQLFTHWNNLYIADNPIPANTLVFPESVTLHKLAANNDIWSNGNLSNNFDINFDINHPMFAVDHQRAYDWHIAPQSNNNGIGTLIMDSPRTIEIHTALNASQYLQEIAAIVGTGTIENPEIPALHKLDWYIKNSGGLTADLKAKLIAIWKSLGSGDYAEHSNPLMQKVNNLGYLIVNTARVLGLRPNEDGKIDRNTEKLKYLPQTLNNPSLGEASADGSFNGYSLNCWGDRGRMMPHLPTTYKNGKSQELYDVFHDIPQQLEMILRQFDVSLSIQHGSEIRVNGLDGKIHSYPNQLAVQLECLQRLEKIGHSTDKNLLATTVSSNEIRGLYSGIGIPVTTNFLNLKDPINSKKILSVPYFTHQKNKPSTAQMLTTVQINLAVINGVLMPKKQPQGNIYNPFNRFVGR